MGTVPEARHGSSTPRQRTGLESQTETGSATLISTSRTAAKGSYGRRTLFRTVESDKELLHAIVHKAHFVVRHQPNGARGSRQPPGEVEISPSRARTVS